MRLERLPCEGSRKVSVLVADNQWCNSNEKLTTVREAIKGIEHLVEYREARPPCRDRIIHVGTIGGVYLDGIAYRPYQLIGKSQDLRAEIMQLYARKQKSKGTGR